MDDHTTLEATSGDTQAVIDAIKALHKPEQITLTDPAGLAPDVPIIVTPKGLQLHDIKSHLDAFRPRPERRKGKAVLLDIASFIAHVNRFKDEDSAVFADNTWRAPDPELRPARNDPNEGWKTPSLTGVLDYHEAVNAEAMEEDENGDLTIETRHNGAANPRFGTHRAHYDFPLSPEFKAWMAMNGQAMSQGNFAAFLEERALDIEPPPVNDGWFSGQAPAPGEDASPEERKRFEFMDLLHTMTSRLNGTWGGPERLMDLSRGLRVNENNKVASASNLNNGTGSIVFESEHTDEKGEKVDVPNLFLISIPIFKNGPKYLMPVRLRYRAKGQVTWFYDTYRHDKVFDHAFDEAVTRVANETGLPVFIGQPEA